MMNSVYSGEGFALSCPESEKQIIGGLLSHYETAGRYAAQLCAEDFSVAVYAEIFTQLNAILRSGKPFDYALLIGKCTDAACKEAIVDCMECFVSSSTLPEHVKAVKSAAGRRAIKRGVTGILERGDYSEGALRSIIEQQNSGEAHDLQEVNARNLESFVLGLNQPKRVVYTGFPSLDSKLNGIRRGTLFIIGARPSTGKTTFAVNIARHQVQNRRRVFFYSLEMQSDMIFEKYAADVCSIPARKFAENALCGKDVGAVSGLMDALRRGNHLIVVDNQFTIEGICADIYAERPDVVIIDYAQRIRSVKGDRFNSERELINYITSELKIIAKRTSACVILLSQIARTGKEAPRMSDLKESGALEEDGDYIAILHRPYVLDKTDTSHTPEETLLLLDKNKFGPCGCIRLCFNLTYQRFTEAAQGRG